MLPRNRSEETKHISETKIKRIYSNESMEAKIFVEFVALIIQNRIYTYLKQEQESETIQNFPMVPAMLRELKKIEMIKMKDKEYVFN